MKTMGLGQWQRIIVVGLAAVCAVVAGMPPAAAQMVVPSEAFVKVIEKFKTGVTNDDLREFIIKNASTVRFDELNRLTIISFSHRGLTYLPSTIGELSELTQLVMPYNRLTAIPPEIGKLTQLKRLILSHNQLTDIPTEITKLTQLSELDLSNNQLTNLPSEIIGKLTQLNCLYLADNQLTSLPPEIGNLTQLHYLDLSHNQLENLPQEIGNLTELTHLYLWHNPIYRSLPISLLNLQKLECLDCGNYDNRESNESNKAFIERFYPHLEWEAATPKMWAVVVGVAAYRHVRSLRYAKDDAYRVYAFLKSPEGGALPEAQLAVLIDEDATRAGILAAMRRLFTQAAGDDIILLYFSGHGTGDALVPFDFDGAANLLAHQDILAILDKSHAKHKLVIADACFAGSLNRSLKSIDQTVTNLYSAFTAASGGLALLMSSKAEETSIEEAGLRQGVFSYYFIKGLGGAADANHDKIITVKEAFDYVSKKVQDYTNYAQNPVLNGKFDPNMPLGAVR